MIKDLRLRSFKAFPHFSVNFQHTSLLVGPNSAGKSTILAALRLSEACLRLAKRVRPSINTQHRGVSVSAYPLPVRDFAALNESVRHNFRDDETSLELEWKNGSRLRAVWPAITPYSDTESAFFYLQRQGGGTPRNIGQVKDSFESIGIIPTLAPLEHEEAILSDEYVKQHHSGRLSSRHFRNQLRLLALNSQWEQFTKWATPWLGGIELKHPVTRYEPSNVDVFFTERGSGVEKEIVWAGDGVQIWLQLLLHLYRAQGISTIILDEPEVFLHADLQRRLVRLLDSMESQVVLATHSTEVLAEADRSSVVWVDKSRRRATRAPKAENLHGLDNALGTSFNLAMAKALRARGVLFVEGKDIKLLKLLSKAINLAQISDEQSLAVVPINGYSNWGHAEAFGWLLREFLGNAVKAMVLLDRDYRTQPQADQVIQRFANVDVHAHVWQKKELESYLLAPTAIAKMTRVPEPEIRDLLMGIFSEMETQVFSSLLGERQIVERSTGKSVRTIAEMVMSEFKTQWPGEDFRYSKCPPKEVLAQLNRKLQENGHKAVSFEGIAKNIRQAEMGSEIISVLRRIDELAT